MSDFKKFVQTGLLVGLDSIVEFVRVMPLLLLILLLLLREGSTDESNLEFL